MTTRPVVVAVSGSGAALARRLAGMLGAPLHGREGRVPEADVLFADALPHLRDLFAAGVPVIGVCASGILIRAVAPLLGDKQTEPPVLSVSDDGAVVVPLLGGHRGANALAERIAAGLGAVAAVTTAGDLVLGVALDVPPAGWSRPDPLIARDAMARLLAGGRARIGGDEADRAAWLSPLPRAYPGQAAEDVLIEVTGKPAQDGVLTYHPQMSVLGVGCARDCPPQELESLVRGVLAAADLSPRALRAIATIDLKADEPAILSLSETLGVPLRFFSPAELEAETPRLLSPSEVVFAEVGCHGVSEAAALAGAGHEAVLTQPKIKTARATCALATAPVPVEPLRGRPRGRLAIVGIGPGQASWRTPEASRLIAEAEEVVGYGLYLDLLGPLVAGKARRDFPLGAEEDRCRYALERAGEGAKVALVCSGDAGIYAMGALVFELLDRPLEPGNIGAEARRAEIVCAPGVSALQAAAARAGAPLGHDFCAISLSDLLTPREDILRRVRAAAEGDFVIAFYNPVSRTRRTLLAEARDILLEARPGETPVMLATSLGRTDEHLRYRRLDALEVDEVDMMTVVLVGSSQSRLAPTGTGPRMYTPRGYARKHAREEGDGT